MPIQTTPIGRFGAAIEHLKQGHCISRAGWNGKNMWLSLQTPDEHSKMSLPYIFICTSDGDLVPWVASHTDMLANDWLRVDFDA
jgi:hypothetical protein